MSRRRWPPWPPSPRGWGSRRTSCERPPQLAAAVLVAVGLVSGSRDPDPWPQARREETAGTRREVAALTWSFIGRDGRVSEAAVRRLRSDATRRLAQRGLVVPGGITSSTATSPHVPD